MVYQISAAMSALRVALLLGCCARPLAERAMWTLDDSVSMMQSTHRVSGKLLQVRRAAEPVKLEPSDGLAVQNFDTATSISADGARVAVGFFTHFNDNEGLGSVYVFDVANGNELVKLTAPGGATGDQFGFSVSMSSNGSRVAVGACRDDNKAGSAYVFDVETGNLVSKLTALDRASDDRFGFSVSISADGARVAVGAFYNDGAGSKSGSAYVFDVASGNQSAKLTATDAATGDRFGYSVSISGDGARVAVGAERDDNNAGSVYVFDLATGQQLRKLTAPDRSDWDKLGGSVSISSDGSRVAAGAPLDNAKGSSSGSAYVFDVATGNQLVKLTALDGSPDDFFGDAVSLSSDGARVAVGAYYYHDGLGSAYVFDVETGSQLFKLPAPNPASTTHFGRHVSISADALRVAVGGNDGSAYLFSLLSTPAPPTPVPVPPTQAPTPVPLPPTQAATHVPTQAPTPAPSQGASATGDPHVTNVDGARFDIMKTGVHEFLRLPRRANRGHGSAEPELLLSVLAAVERTVEDECHESYLQQVDVTGGWLNSSGPLRFRAVGDSSDRARATMSSINGSSVDALALGSDSRVRSFLEVVKPRTPPTSGVSGAVRKVPMLTVRLSFSGATLNIDWMHRRIPGGTSLNHLNFKAFGLRRFSEGTGMDIGGILGRDDHSDAASLPDSCKPAEADLRISNRASGEEGDLQVITAAL